MSRKKKKRSYIRVCYKFPRWTEETKNGTKFFWSVVGFHFAAGNSHRINFIHNVSNGSFQHPLEIPSLSQFGTTLAPLFSPRQRKSLMGQPVLRGVTVKWGAVTISSGPPSLEVEISKKSSSKLTLPWERATDDVVTSHWTIAHLLHHAYN